MSTGFFSNPAPQHDLVNPNYAHAPQYVLPELGSSISWGRPMAPGVQALVDSEGYAHADGSGYTRATNLDGSLWRPEAPLVTLEIEPGDAWGYTSWMSFEGRSVDPTATIPFVVGQLVYNNGVTATGTDIDSVVLNVSASSSSGLNSLALPIAIVTTPNHSAQTAEQNADFIYFPDHPEFGSFRVYEGGYAVVELVAEFGSLHARGFGDVSGSGFLSPSITAVPELGQMAWVMGGCLLLWGGWSRVNRQRVPGKGT